MARSHAKPALGFIFITLVLDILGIGIVVPILPTLVEELSGKTIDAAAYLYGLLAMLYALMQFLFAPLLGSLSDRYGRRPVILISLFGAGLDYFLLAWAPTLEWFFVGRILAGITGANFSAATAYIADISTPEKRAANFGLVGAAFGLGFSIGPAIGGLLGQTDLRLPFIVAGVITLLNWLYGLFVLPESLAASNRRKFSWGRSNPVGALLHLRKYPMVLGLAGVYFLASIAHQVLPATWALFTKYRFSWEPLHIGMSLGAVGIMAAIVQGGLTRKILPKTGEQNAALIGLGISAVSFCLYGLATQGWMIYAIIVLGSLGGLATPAIQGMVSRGVGDDEQGGVQGSMSSLNSVAAIIGTPLATGLFGYFISDSAPLYLPGIAFLFSAVLTLAAAALAVHSFRKR
ncbi:MAG: DHA1 family tetracycline resistance protein-like MFS transporter [Verrucomicrobiales bacterium]|jgi:DHA1 family tetracycline resistance protein-like MFS transporter